MKYNYFIFLFIVCLLALASCADCEDCGVPGKPPSIRLKFFPRSAIRFYDSLVRVYNSDIKLYNDSIKNAATKDDSVKLEGFKKILQDKTDSLSKIRTDFNRNIVTIDSIRALEVNKTYDALKDSTSNIFRIPLNMHNDSSRFLIHLKHRKHEYGDTLVFKYKRNPVPKDQSIRVILENLSISTSTFDSLTVECMGKIIYGDRGDKKLIRNLDDDCANHEKTTLNIYY